MSNGIILWSGGGWVVFEIGDNWGGKVLMDIYSIYIEKNIVRKDSKIFFNLFYKLFFDKKLKYWDFWCFGKLMRMLVVREK